MTSTPNATRTPATPRESTARKATSPEPASTPPDDAADEQPQASPQPPTVVTFEMSGQSFRFDAHPARLNGREALLIEEVTGDQYPNWTRRIGAGRIGAADVLLMAYMAVRRNNDLVEWSMFIETVNPYTMDNVKISVADDDG